MAPRTPIASLFSSCRARLNRAPAALYRASSEWMVVVDLRASTRGGTAPDLTILTLLAGSMERLTRAAVALIWMLELVERIIGTRAERRVGVQREILRWLLSLAECLRVTRPDSLTEI